MRRSVAECGGVWRSLASVAECGECGECGECCGVWRS